MLSLIICSRSPQQLETVKASVKATIGVPHEVIAIDNADGKYGICAAYNSGASRARFDLLCFMHEDIILHTPDWGRIVARILADATIGVVGVAGSTYLLNAPSAWWWAGDTHSRMQIQHTLPGKPSSIDYVNPNGESLADVAALDGVWLCSRKQVWEQFPFDEQTFPEFHFYDLDYCTNIWSHYRICVTFEVLIEHSSLGSLNEAWLRNALRFYGKWREQLPIGPAVVSDAEEQQLERAAAHQFLQTMVTAKISLRARAKYFGKLLSYKPLYYANRATRWMLLKYWPGRR